MNRTTSTLLLIALLLVPVFGLAQEEPEKRTPEASPGVRVLPGEADPELFGPEPDYSGAYDADEQLAIYGAKYMNKTSEPLISHGIRLYDRGAYTPRPTWLGRTNPINYGFMAFGDLRIAADAYNAGKPGANGKKDQQQIAARLNLDLDFALTATERFHAFIRPLDKNGSFTRYQLNASGTDDKFIHNLDFNANALFFEGDIGQITGGLQNKAASYDLPIALGRVPLFTQNGIWLQDAVDGGAIGITAHNNPRFDISNYDLTFFAGIHDVTTAAVPSSEKPKLVGLAGFADMRRGYVEFGYGYVGAENNDLSYHNLTASFSRRYLGLLNNSVRLIGNIGQKGIAGNKTADGVLLLLENSFTRPNPVTVVPYFNLFAGYKHPQPLARAADVGGVLGNTGINFQSDGMTGFPFLDPFAQDSYGGAFGWEYLFNLQRQIVLEGAIVERMNGNNAGSQYAIGARYQHKLNNAWILRLDAMRGWIAGNDDIYGARVELRRKF